MQNTGHVNTHRAIADEQFPGDLPVGRAGAEQGQDLELPLGEPVGPVCPPGCAAPAPARAGSERSARRPPPRSGARPPVRRAPGRRRQRRPPCPAAWRPHGTRPRAAGSRPPPAGAARPAIARAPRPSPPLSPAPRPRELVAGRAVLRPRDVDGRRRPVRGRRARPPAGRSAPPRPPGSPAGHRPDALGLVAQPDGHQLGAEAVSWVPASRSQRLVDGPVAAVVVPLLGEQLRGRRGHGGDDRRLVDLAAAARRRPGWRGPPAVSPMAELQFGPFQVQVQSLPLHDPAVQQAGEHGRALGRTGPAGEHVRRVAGQRGPDRQLEAVLGQQRAGLPAPPSHASSGRPVYS